MRSACGLLTPGVWPSGELPGTGVLAAGARLHEEASDLGIVPDLMLANIF